MTELGDFKFVAIRVTAARQVADFGVARSLDEVQINLVLGASKEPKLLDIGKRLTLPNLVKAYSQT